MPTVLPMISPCVGPPPAPPPVDHTPPRNAATMSMSRCCHASIVISTYSAIACSWPETLHTVTPAGNDGTSIKSSPAATDCSSLTRGAAGKSFFQMWLTTISASASSGISRCASSRSNSTDTSSFSVVLARIASHTPGRAPKLPRNTVFIAGLSGSRNHVDQALAAHEAADIVGNLVPAPPHHAGGPAGIVRGDDDVGEPVEIVARAAPVGLLRGRVLPPHVERGAGDGAVAQRCVERVLVHHRAARNVDEIRARLHQREPARVDEPRGLRAERGAQRQRVAQRQHLVEPVERIDALDPGIGRTLAAVGGEDAAAEGGGAARHLAPDPAVADDAEGRAAQFAVRRAPLDPACAPRAALAELTGNLEQAVMQGKRGHHHVFGNRGLVAERVAHRAAARQSGEVEQVHPRRHRLHQPHPRRRRVVAAPVVGDDDVGLGRRRRQPGAVDRIVDDDGAKPGRQLLPNPLIGAGGHPAEKQRLHRFTACLARKSSRTVMPSPGRSGTSMSPSRTGKSSSTRSCRSGLAPSEYSTMKPAGDAAATASPAAKAGAPAHRCGASFRLCALARSGCMMSTAPKSARSRKSCRVNSLSPAAIGMSVARRTSAQPALSSAVTGSSNQARSQSSTSRQKRLASATDRVPWASHISPISGPSAARAARTRRAEWRGSPSMMPTRILTAPKPPRAT